MSNNTDIVVYHSAKDNSEGWVDIMIDFISHYFTQQKVAAPKIEKIEFGNSSSSSNAIIVLSNNTLDQTDFKVSSENVFIVCKAEISNVHFPKGLSKDHIYRFFEKDRDTGQTAIFNTSATSDVRSLYWMKLLDLSKDVFITTHSIDNNSSKGKTVFVAETSGEQIKYRDQVVRELKRHGFNITPTSTLPDNEDELKKRIQSDLENSSLSIHIIGNDDATLNTTATRSKVEIQNEIAAKHADTIYKDGGSSHDFSRFLWISPDIQFIDEKQQDKVDQLKRDVEALKGAEVVQTPMELFKSIILYRMSDNYQHSEDDKDAMNFENSVYVIYDQFEIEEAKAIVERIKSKGNIVLEPRFEGEQLDIINHHRNCLVNCDSVLVVYSNDNPKWALSKVNDMRKSPGFGRIKPFKAKAIYLDSKDNNIKESDKTLSVIEKRGDFTKDLEPFISQIN